MIRVTADEKSKRIVITIDGSLSGECVFCVEDCCNQAISKGKRVQLLLRDVLTIDEGGRALLSQAAAKGVCLKATGVYTSYLLRSIRQTGGKRPESGEALHRGAVMAPSPKDEGTITAVHDPPASQSSSSLC